jgi:23S rRNA-intervening sequence protein
MAEEMIVFTRCYDLLAWLMPKAEQFPRAFRFSVTQRLMDAALDLQEALFEAQSQREGARLAALRSADSALGRLRLYLRLAHHWCWLNAGQFEHVSGIVAEIGRLLGGWLKQAGR